MLSSENNMERKYDQVIVMVYITKCIGLQVIYIQ